MARSSKNQDISSKNKRLKLAVRREPHWFSIGAGGHLGYRKTGEAKGTWIVRYYSKEHGRHFESLGTADDSAASMGSNEMSYADAFMEAKARISRLIQPDNAEVDPKSTYTVAQAMDDYIVHSEAEKRKKLTRTRLLIEAHIKPTLGKIQLNKLTHTRVKAWRDALPKAAPRKRTGYVKEKVWCIRLVHGKERGQYRERATKVPLPPAHRATIDEKDAGVLRKRQATANRILTVLKAALNYAKAETRKTATDAAWVDVKPFKNVDAPKIRFLTMDEVGVLIPACESDFRELVQGALVSGCRYGELTAMFVNAFDAGQGTVYVADSKNGESRYVESNDEGIAFFKQLTHGRDANEIMFLRSNGKPWKHSEQQRPMDAACETAKLEGVTFHILRHTYASHAVMNGMPIAVLSAQLGHKDTRITERHYAHLCQTYKQKLIRENAPSFGFAASRPGPVLVTKAS